MCFLSPSFSFFLSLIHSLYEYWETGYGLGHQSCCVILLSWPHAQPYCDFYVHFRKCCFNAPCCETVESTSPLIVWKCRQSSHKLPKSNKAGARRPRHSTAIFLRLNNKSFYLKRQNKKRLNVFAPKRCCLKNVRKKPQTNIPKSRSFSQAEFPQSRGRSKVTPEFHTRIHTSVTQRLISLFRVMVPTTHTVFLVPWNPRIKHAHVASKRLGRL